MRHTRRKSGERGGLGAGAGILGLLVAVAIMMYLMVGPMGGGGAGGGAGGAAPGGGTSYLGAIQGSQQRARQFSVEQQHYSLKQMMVTYHLEHDEYPETFADMDQENHPAWNDAWGTQLRFSVDDTVSPGMLTVESAGKDTTWGSPDDLRHTAALPF